MILPPLRKSKLRIYYQQLDRTLAQGLGDQHVSCHKGCNACCHQVVQISYLEGVELLQGASKAGINIDRMKLDEDAKLQARIHPDDVAGRLNYFNRKRPCTFLTDEGCGIYKSRPAACRLVFAQSEPAKCADTKSDATLYDTSETARVVYAQIHGEHVERLLMPVMAPMPVILRGILGGQSPSEILRRAEESSQLDEKAHEQIDVFAA